MKIITRTNHIGTTLVQEDSALGARPVVVTVTGQDHETHAASIRALLETPDEGEL